MGGREGVLDFVDFVERLDSFWGKETYVVVDLETLTEGDDDDPTMVVIFVDGITVIVVFEV